MIQKSYDNSPSLYLIPTPIGNLDDITIRSLNTLRFVDVIFCEDTRDTSLLLKNYDIKKNLISCHEYNENIVIEKAISLLKEGKNIGLVTDQGTPIISDPGFIVSRAVIEAGFHVIGLPGSTAFVPALIMSGIEPSPFLYYGFLNSKSSKQLRELDALKNLTYTIIFYESVHRLEETLTNILSVFGDRDIALCREISKIHEEVIRDKISNIIPMCSSLKGEFVLIVRGNTSLIDFSNLTIVEHVQLYLDDGLDEKEALKKVANERGVSKSIIYSEYHKGK